MNEAEAVDDGGKGQPETRDDAVPAWKFVKLKKERDQVADQLEQLRGELATTRTAAEAAAKHASRVAELEEELGLVRTGLTDPEGIDVARTLWRRLPEDKRPATVAEYVASVKEAPPKALAAYLGQQVAAADPTPKPTGGNGRQPDAGGAPTAEAIRAARLKAARTPPGSAEWREFQRLADAARRR